MNTAVLDDATFGEARSRQKDLDKAFIYNEIRSNPGVSQKQLLERHQLRPTALSNTVKELISDGLIRVSEHASNGRQGRPEKRLETAENRFVSLAIYTESHEFRGAVVNSAGDVIGEASMTLPESAGEKELGHLYEQLIRTLKEQAPMESEVVGLGLSLVGNVDSEQQVWIECGRWPNIRNFDLSTIPNRHALPLYIARDLDSALYHELVAHPDYRDGTTLLLHWGTGIGFAYSYEGRIIGSRTGRFGTIGQTIVDIRCPEEGMDFESRAAIPALFDTVVEKYPDATDDERTFAQILQDPEIVDLPAVQNAVEYMAYCVANLCMMLYPERILFLGPFAENGDILEQLETKLRAIPLKHDINQRTALLAIDRGYRGCIFGSTYDLFRRALQRYLVARY